MLTRAFVPHYWTNGLAGIPLPRTEITGRKSGLWKSGPLGARSVTGPERLFFCSFAARTQSPIYHGLRHWLILVPLCGFLWIRCSPFLPESKALKRRSSTARAGHGMTKRLETYPRSLFLPRSGDDCPGSGIRQERRARAPAPHHNGGRSDRIRDSACCHTIESHSIWV